MAKLAFNLANSRPTSSSIQHSGHSFSSASLLFVVIVEPGQQLCNDVGLMMIFALPSFSLGSHTKRAILYLPKEGQFFGFLLDAGSNKRQNAGFVVTFAMGTISIHLVCSGRKFGTSPNHVPASVSISVCGPDRPQLGTSRIWPAQPVSRRWLLGRELHKRFEKISTKMVLRGLR